MLRTQNVSEQNQKHFCVPDTKLVSATNGETFVSATMCRQQCVLVCQGLKTHPGKYPIDTLFAFCQYNNKEYLSKLRHVKKTQAKDLSVNNLSLEAKHSSFSPTTIGFYRIPGGGWGGTPIYGLYRYVPRNRVWFSRFSVLK